MTTSLTKKGQVTTIDFIISFIIIVITVLLAIRVVLLTQDTSNFDHVQEQAISASNILMSEGVPNNWDQTTLVKPGILSNKVLNLTKLNQLQNATYDDIKSKLTPNYNHYIYFTNRTDIFNFSACGYGSNQVQTDTSCTPTFPDASNRAKVTRLIAHNDSVISMVVIAWD